MLKKPDLMDFLPKQGESKPAQKPVVKTPEKKGVAELLGVSNKDQKAKQTKAIAGQRAIEKKKYDATARTVIIKTAYGAFDVDHKGELTPEKYKEYQGKIEKWATGQGMKPKTGAVRPEMTPEAPKGMMEYALENPAVKAVAGVVDQANVPLPIIGQVPGLNLGNIREKVKDVTQSAQNSNQLSRGQKELAGLVGGFAESALDPVRGTVKDVGTAFYDENASPLEKLMAGASLVGRVAPVAAGVGKTGAALKAGESLGSAVGKGVAGAVESQIGTAPKQEASPLEKLMAESKVVPETPPPPSAVVPTPEASPVFKKVESEWVEPFVPQKYGKTAEEVLNNGNQIIDDAQAFAHEYATKQGFEKWTTDYEGMEKSLREKISKLQKQIDRHSGIGEGYPLLVKEMKGYKSKLQEVLDGKKLADVDNAAYQTAFVEGMIKYGESLGVPELFGKSDSTLHGYVYRGRSIFDRRSKINDFLVAKKPVPESVLNEFPKLKKIAEERGLVAKPIMEGTAITSTSTPLTKSTPEPPGVTTSAPMADLQPNTTGISNAANLDDVEAGLLTEVAKGEGKSAKAVYEASRGREDYLEVAKRVRDGAPLSAEDTATLLAGGQKLTKRVYDTREAVRQAIANGADQATITKLNNEYAKARTIKDEFAQDVQKGKSGWSDVGRVLAKKVDIDTGNIEQVAEEARIRKGADLTDKELETLQNQVNELKTSVSEKDAKIASLMDDLVKATEATSTIRRTGFSKEQTGSVRIQAKNRFQEAKRKAGSVASLNALQGVSDPEVIKAFGEYVRAVVDDGARGITEVIQKMADDGVAVDPEDIYKGMTARTGLRKLSDIQKEIMDAKRALLEESAKATGQEIPRRNMTATQKISFRERALESQIKKLDEQISTGKIAPRSPKLTSKKIQELETVRKSKQAELDSIVKTPQAKAQPKAKAVNQDSAWKKNESILKKEEAELLRNLSADTKALNKEQRLARQQELEVALSNNAKADNIRVKIQELLKQAEDKTLPAPKAKEIDDRIKNLTEMRNQALQEARKASPDYRAYQDKKIATKSKGEIQKRIDELNEQIKTGQYIEAQPKVKREIDAEVYRLRQIEKMKQKQVKDAIERMRPKSAAEKFGSYSSEVKLLNPASRVKDLISNTQNLVATGIETPARFLVDASTAKFTKSDMILGVEGNAETLGIIKDRVKATAKTDLQEAWQGLDSGAADKFGYAKGLGGKAAAMTDAPFKTIYRETANVRLAEEKAKRVLGKDSTMAKVKDMRDEILSNLDEHPDIQMGAEEYALYKTFNNDNAISKFNAQVKANKSDAFNATYDELIGRFSKVITNVGLDKLDRTGLGIVRGLTKVVTSKGALTAAERMIINDMMAKGMTGLPIVTLGYFLGDKVKGEIKDGYRKYIDHGDLGDMGGVMAAFLYGADMKQAEKLGSEQGAFRFRTSVKLATDSPFSANIKDLFDLPQDPSASDFADYGVKKLTNIAIPGGFRDLARRMDSKSFPIMTGKEKEREKYPKGTKAAVDKLNHKSAEAIWKMIVGETKSKVPVMRQQLPAK